MALPAAWPRLFSFPRIGERLTALPKRKRQRRTEKPRRPRLEFDLLEDRMLLSAVPLGSEFRANTTTAGDQLTFADSKLTVAGSSTGDFVIAWTSSPAASQTGQDGSGRGIYAQRYNNSGQAQGNEFRVNAFTTNDQSGHAAAMDASGNFVIVWRSVNQDGSGNGVYAQQYNANGTTRGNEFRVNTTTSGEQTSPKVAMDTDGDFIVTWTGNGPGDSNGVFARRYSANGTALTGEFLVNTPSTGDQTLPIVAANGAGAFVIAWQSAGQDGSGAGVYARRYNASGEAQGSEFLVNTTTTGDQGLPAVALNDDGRFWIVWTSGPLAGQAVNLGQDGSGRGVFAQRFDATGAALGNEFRVNTFTTGDQLNVSIDSDRLGNMVVTWTTAIGDGSGAGIVARRFNIDGLALSGDILINNTVVGNQQNSAVSAAANGDFVIAWSGNGTGDASGVFARRYQRDDFGDDAASAHSITLAATGLASQDGEIEATTDVDVFRFVATSNGVMTVQQNAKSGSALDSFLAAFDNPLSPPITSNNDFGDGKNSQVQFVVLAGQTYYLRAAGNANTTGAYSLSLTLTPDAGNDMATAQVITLSSTGVVNVLGATEQNGDQDFYRFVAPASGALTIRQDRAAGSAIDPLLTAFASDGGEIARNDDSRATLNSQVRIRLEAGQTYFVRAGAFGATTGIYTLTFSPDDVGDDFDSAKTISTAVTGIIDGTDDVDFYQFTATATGGVTIEQRKAAGSSLDSYLFVFDSQRRLVALSDDVDSSGDSRVRFNTEAGLTYFIRAGAFPNVDGFGNAGAYELSITTGDALAADDFANTIADARALDLAGNATRVSAEIGTAGDIDVFRFTATQSGSVAVRLDPTEGSAVQGYLYAFDAAGQTVANDYETTSLEILAGRANSLVRFNVVAGQSYHILAGGFRQTAGGFDLSIQVDAAFNPEPDDFSGSFAAAQSIDLGTNGALVVAGNIGVAGDADLFRFVAPETKSYLIRLDATPGSVLDTYLYLYIDEQQRLLSSDDSAGTRNSAVQLNATAGKTYFIKATGFGSSTGRYNLGIAPAGDDFGNSFDGASNIALASDSTAVQFGTIENAGDADVFQFVATFSGEIAVRQEATAGSPLDSFLSSYDAVQTPVTANNDFDGGLGSEVRFQVVAGQTYFVKASGYGSSIGQYRVTFSPAGAPANDDFGDTFAAAHAVQFGGAGDPAIVNGNIDVAGDVDFFRFVAPVTGAMVVELAAPDGDSLDPVLYAYDDTRGIVASNDDGDGLNSRLTMAVVAGGTYYLRAAGANGSSGQYALALTPSDDEGTPEGHAFDSATPIVLNQKLIAGSAFGVIEEAGETDLYRFVAPVTGAVAVRQEWTAGSRLDSYLFAFDEFHRLIASNDDNGVTQDSLVQFTVVAGQTYYLKAASSTANEGPARQSTGAYRLAVSSLADDFGNSVGEARTMILDAVNNGAQSGVVEVAGDVDLFQFVAQSTGRVAIRQVAVGTSDLDSLLVVYDADGNEIARNDDGGADGGSEVQLDVTAGRRFYVQTGGYGDSTGRYQVSFAEVATDDFGADFQSAQVILLSPGGSSNQAGSLEEAGDIDLFRITAAITGTLTAQVSAANGAGSPGRLKAFAFLGGMPAQIASDTASRGTLQVDVVAGQSVYVQVASADGGVGEYVLNFSTTAGVSSPTGITEAGKAAAEVLRDQFTALITQSGPSEGDLQQLADALADAVTQAFVSSFGGTIDTDYLVLLVDPVDFVVTDASQRQAGYTSGGGFFNEIKNSFFSGNGTLELLILPNALASQYKLELVGVGADSVVATARLVTAANPDSPLVPKVTLQDQATNSPNLVVAPGPKEALVAVLDFRQPVTTSTTTLPASSPSGVTGVNSFPLLELLAVSTVFVQGSTLPTSDANSVGTEAVATALAAASDSGSSGDSVAYRIKLLNSLERMLVAWTAWGRKEPQRRSSRWSMAWRRCARQRRRCSTVLQSWRSPLRPMASYWKEFLQGVAQSTTHGLVSAGGQVGSRLLRNGQPAAVPAQDAVPPPPPDNSKPDESQQQPRQEPLAEVVDQLFAEEAMAASEDAECDDRSDNRYQSLLACGLVTAFFASGLFLGQFRNRIDTALSTRRRSGGWLSARAWDNGLAKYDDE